MELGRERGPRRSLQQLGDKGSTKEQMEKPKKGKKRANHNFLWSYKWGPFWQGAAGENHRMVGPTLELSSRGRGGRLWRRGVGRGRRR